MFSAALNTYRDKHELSQEEMVGLLVRLDESLSNLDRVTYSRWERGVTNPSLDKKYIILKNLYLFDALFQELEAGNESEKLNQQLVLNKRYSNSRLGVDTLYRRKSKQICYIVTEFLSFEEYDFFRDYGEKVYDHELSFEGAKEFNTKALNNFHYTFYDDDDLLLGHMFCHVTVKDNIIELIPAIEKSTIVKENEKVLFVGSVYSTSYRLTLVHFYFIKEILLSDLGVGCIYTQVFNEAILRFFQLLGGKVVSRGEASDRGVPYKNKEYKWIGIVINSDDFLKYNALTPIDKPDCLNKLDKEAHMIGLEIAG
ncbi:helix-turn-helix transcriptional regulator [Vibrio chagasii]|uniref:helix-turn-helix transcriptional regulator n=1 Tax=Vibrio chagasii TaxID=170679 RepID=UPI001EFD50C0|nr:helix-turn-helix transcriptional regulator [Vibrio chagasii]MCG9604084.1 helix-turn-helix transcriptional regulator [Vibrio chagasii]